MMIGERLLAASTFSSGMTWEEYLDRVTRSQLMQIKRYESISDHQLERFSSISLAGKAVILSNAKCGDGAWAVPHLSRVLHHMGNIECRFFFRDEHPELMDRMLSSGKRSIPKLAMLDEEFRVIGGWGPYPSGIIPFVQERAGKIDRAEWYPDVMKYYREKGVTDLLNDLYEALADASVQAISS